LIFNPILGKNPSKKSEDHDFTKIAKNNSQKLRRLLKGAKMSDSFYPTLQDFFLSSSGRVVGDDFFPEKSRSQKNLQLFFGKSFWKEIFTILTTKILT